MPERIKFILNYGLCYKVTTDKNGIRHIEKHIMRYPQIFATMAIADKMSESVKKGVIWHTQGSGKTALAFSNVHYLSVNEEIIIPERVYLSKTMKNLVNTAFARFS
jgi:type I restriction enzyme R subunit